MVYTNPKMEALREKFPFWRRLHRMLEIDSLSLLEDPRVVSILEANPAYAQQPLAMTLRDIADERQAIGYELIARQEALAEAGITRAKALYQGFNYYARDILQGNDRGARTDLAQQCLDVAIMFVLSHTQIVFAGKYAQPDDRKLLSYHERINAQEARLKAFKNLGLDQFKEHLPPVEAMTPEGLAAFVQHFEDCTLDVANSNIALCEQVGKLVMNKIRLVHYWREAVEMGDVPTYGSEKEQQAEIKFEADLLRIYIRRCEILLARGQGIFELGGQVMDLPDLDDIPNPPTFGWA